jgi:hypothetical protein
MIGVLVEAITPSFLVFKLVDVGIMVLIYIDLACFRGEGQHFLTTFLLSFLTVFDLVFVDVRLGCHVFQRGLQLASNNLELLH